MKGPSTIFCLLASVLASWSSGLVGCDDSSTGSAAGGNSVQRALVITSDYQTGAFSTVGLADRDVVRDVQTIHPDTVCRYDPVTGNFFLVARQGADAVTVLDPAGGFAPIAEYSVGTGNSNAQDIAVISKERAIVPRLGEPSLLVVNPLDGTEIEQIDLSAYADGDGIPDASSALARKNKVFVTLERLTQWMPSDHSSVLVIDGPGGQIESEITLTGKNPVDLLKLIPGNSKVALAEAGAYSTLDGGVETLDLDHQILSGISVTEEVLGGDLSYLAVLSETKGYAVVAASDGASGMITKVVSFNPKAGTRTIDLLVGTGFFHSYLAVTPDGEELWVTDRDPARPGLRIFSTEDDSELTQVALDVGLPPVMICFGQ